MEKLKKALVSSHKLVKNDILVQSFFDEMIESIYQFPYSESDFIKFSFNSEPELIGENTIASLNPVKYIQCKNILKDRIKPIFAIKKVNQNEPYFPAFFISNKNSNIKTIRSKDIKTIYTVSSTSASGYVAPIYKLWESGIINTPNEGGIIEKGWDLVKLGSHREVEQRILSDNYAIGATGQFTSQEDPSKALVNVLLRYYYLPQDVLVISSNLQPYEEQIKDWFKDIFNDEKYGMKYIDAFLNSSTRISGIYDLNNEFINSMHELQVMANYVHDFENMTDGKEHHTKEESTLSISHNLKMLLAKGEVSIVIENLLEHFKTTDNKDAMNTTVMLSSKLYSINQKENLNISSSEGINIEKAQLNKALLGLIDTKLSNT